MDLATETMQFLRTIDNRFPRDQVVVGVISGIAAYISLSSGYSEDAIDKLADSLMNAIECEHRRQEAERN